MPRMPKRRGGAVAELPDERHQPFIAAEVERANGDALPAGPLDKGAKRNILFLFAGRRQSIHEHEFGAKQADAGGAGLDHVVHLHRQFDIRLQSDGHAVLTYRRLSGEPLQRALFLLPFAAAPVILLERGRRGMDDDLAQVAIDQNAVARADRLQQTRRAKDRRQAEGASQNSRMALRAARLRGDPGNVLGVQLRRIGRGQFLGDDNAAARDRVQRLSCFLGELARPSGCRPRERPRHEPTSRRPASRGSFRRSRSLRSGPRLPR